MNKQICKQTVPAPLHSHSEINNFLKAIYRTHLALKWKETS